MLGHDINVMQAGGRANSLSDSFWWTPAGGDEEEEGGGEGGEGEEGGGGEGWPGGEKLNQLIIRWNVK